MDGPPHVAILLDTSSVIGRGMLRGIAKYARLHTRWELYLLLRPVGGPLPKDHAWKGGGIIAQIRSAEMEDLICATGVPFVASNVSKSKQPKSGFGEIRYDSAAMARLAAEHLLERGLRRFAYCGWNNCNWSSFREQAFLRLVTDKGYDCSTHHVRTADWMQQRNWIQTWEQEQPILVRWLRSLPKPVGLMACNDVCGREVLQACAAAKLRVPDDVAVVGVDNDDIVCQVSNPPLSSVALEIEKAGYEAARVLDGLMSGELSGRCTVNVGPTHVVTRRSSDVIAQEDPVVVTALRFIRDHSRDPIYVPDVLREVDVSRRTVERRFSKAIGRSIRAEITRRRIELAKRMLLETDLPIHRLAGAAGFGSLKTFNRNFYQSEGTPPWRFRERFKVDARGTNPNRGLGGAR